MPPFREFNAEAVGREGTRAEASPGTRGLAPAPVLRDVLLAVVIELGMAPCVAAAIGFKWPRRPARIVILLLKLG